MYKNMRHNFVPWWIEENILDNNTCRFLGSSHLLMKCKFTETYYLITKSEVITAGEISDWGLDVLTEQ